MTTLAAEEERAPTHDALVRLNGVVKHFPITSGFFLQRQVAAVRAVDGVTFDVRHGETLGVVGESGCGKSTLARLILRLLDVTGGTIEFDGEEVTRVHGSALRRIRRRMQMVFQDPFASLNPRMPVGRIVAEPLEIWGTSRSDANRQANDLLARVGLKPEHASRFPHEFSGGQRQRVGVARALALNPKLIVCDEPVSALDVSVRAQILNLLADLQRDLALTYVFISHDLSIVRQVCDSVAVMYLGKIVEFGSRNDIYDQPLHPYTQALLSAIPVPDPVRERVRERVILQGDVPSPVSPPSGCRFRTRCWKAQDICAEVEPPLADPGLGHPVACHFPEVRKVV